MSDLSAAAWNARYLENNAPWDLNGPTPELARLAKESWFPKSGRALIPGGGRGFDALLLAKRGLIPHLVDFAPTPLLAAQQMAMESKLPLLAYRRDFFTLPLDGAMQASFDLMWEYTFYCAIDPTLREAYAKTAHSLLKPGAMLVALFFPTEMKSAGPPFEVSRREIEELFAPYFEINFMEPKESVKPRAGREFIGVFKRI
jgi:hypothetical protein